MKQCIMQCRLSVLIISVLFDVGKIHSVLMSTGHDTDMQRLSEDSLDSEDQTEGLVLNAVEGQGPCTVVQEHSQPG